MISIEWFVLGVGGAFLSGYLVGVLFSLIDYRRAHGK